MPEVIDSFSGEYGFLSNFYLHPIWYMGLHFPCTENAYQAAKLDPRDRTEEWALHLTCSPRDSRKLGRKLGPLRPNWDKLRDVVMKEVLIEKFKDPILKQKLLATGDAKLIEGNWWHDTHFGVCNGKGDNVLGQLLMYLRIRIRLEDILIEDDSDTKEFKNEYENQFINDPSV